MPAIFGGEDWRNATREAFWGMRVWTKRTVKVWKFGIKRADKVQLPPKEDCKLPFRGLAYRFVFHFLQCFSTGCALWFFLFSSWYCREFVYWLFRVRFLRDLWGGMWGGWRRCLCGLLGSKACCFAICWVRLSMLSSWAIEFACESIMLAALVLAFL